MRLLKLWLYCVKEARPPPTCSPVQFYFRAPNAGSRWCFSGKNGAIAALIIQSAIEPRLTDEVKLQKRCKPLTNPYLHWLAESERIPYV